MIKISLKPLIAMLSISATFTALKTSNGRETPPGVASLSPLAFTAKGDEGATKALPEPLCDLDSFLVSLDRVAAQDSMRPTLFRTTIGDDHSGLSFFVNLVVD